MYIIYNAYKSSTAQGSGSSFNKRKLIGEVSGCDAWMAQQIHRWAESWLGDVFGVVPVVTSSTTAECSVV